MGNFIAYPEEEENEEECQHLQQKEKEIEPLDIAVLPPELIHNIVTNLTYEDYVKFEECNKFTDRVLNSGKFYLHHWVSEIYINKKTTKIEMAIHYSKSWKRARWHVAARTPVKFYSEAVLIDCPATGGRIRGAAKLFKKNKTTTTMIRVTSRATQIRFTPEDLDHLITAVKAQHLYSIIFIPREFFSNPIGLNKVCLFYSILNLNRDCQLSAVVIDTCGCTDEDLLKLKVPSITMINDFITDRGLNRFLKQWKKNEREIIWFEMEFGSTQGVRNYDLILEGLEANPLWTPALHGDSIISALNIEEFPLAADPTHLYSLWRCDDLNAIRLITLTMEKIEISTTYCERDVLLNNLTEDQYYETFRSCKWCELEFCYHRGWYSTQHFKRRFPGWHSAIIEAVKLVKGVYTLARYSQVLLGAPLLPRLISEEEIKRIRHEEQIDQSYWKSFSFRLWLHVLNH